MFKVTELQGRSQIFTLKDGTSFRILSRESKNISKDNVSNEIRIAVKMGLISLVPVDIEVPKTIKKSGGN